MMLENAVTSDYHNGGLSGNAVKHSNTANVAIFPVAEVVRLPTLVLNSEFSRILLQIMLHSVARPASDGIVRQDLFPIRFR